MCEGWRRPWVIRILPNTSETVQAFVNASSAVNPVILVSKWIELVSVAKSRRMVGPVRVMSARMVVASAHFVLHWTVVPQGLRSSLKEAKARWSSFLRDSNSLRIGSSFPPTC